ncbi:2,3-dihydro-2,3-dihydroxybenzoate dehydrogenase [Rhizobium sp. CG5]|uniref:2,3-dihydro-2,3-dihydroxybenzoate dehydrogenase n=1 Tax=Rhizobium sp. CG5 TaxID=2726076 RepID=UPI0020333064|nr:2,3-dihydro-2,3-dihydroxybenzoate dehydrogenase [Rhizobium sp. CG5]MCM2476479.1 2,3-dihydro-2,3-dihydroxybenzoate dehydrogenase [Rhizobium sp. CG5]
MQLTGFEGKTALVTGAGGGIGLAVVKLLLAMGVTVAATDVETAALAALDAERLLVHRLDVCDGAAVDRFVDGIARDWGHVDFGVNVAGVLQTTSVVETSEAVWNRVIAINATGVFLVSRALARSMIAQGSGAIVTVGSNAAGIPRQNMAAYAASKAAATMFTRCLGLELGPHGIRCNIVAPGSTLTPMQTGMWADDSGAEAVIEGSLKTYRTGIPLRKLAMPDDIAQAVVFLLSDQACHITMADLYVDGGATLRG